MYKLPKNLNVPFAASRDYAENNDAAFAASWEHVTVWVFKQLKCAVVCFSRV